MLINLRKHISIWTAAGITALALALSPAVLAQGAGDGPHGSVHGGGMMMAKELNLSADQQAQIKQIHEANRPKFEALKQDQSLSQQDRKAQMKVLHESEKAQIDAILTPEQKQKMEAMHQDHEGMRGPGAMAGMLTKELNLSDDQQAKMKSIFESGHQKMSAIHDNPSLSDQDKHAQTKQLHESMKSQINGILTPEQQQKFAEMHKRMERPHGQHGPGDGSRPSDGK